MTFGNGTDTLVVANHELIPLIVMVPLLFQPVGNLLARRHLLRLNESDANGTEITATSPTAAKVIPTSTNVESPGIQGQSKDATSLLAISRFQFDMDSPTPFEDGRLRRLFRVGEYTINSDGSVTFTPEKQYIGTPTPVTVKRVDKMAQWK